MGELAALESRIAHLEAELLAHRRATMMIFLEYVARRPRERAHLIALLKDLISLMGQDAAQVSKALIQELQATATRD